jgi:hypothetical protein
VERLAGGLLFRDKIHYGVGAWILLVSTRSIGHDVSNITKEEKPA